jgi:xanthine/uracil permease
VTVSAASNIVTWAMVTVAAAGLVSSVMLERWAARILVVAVALLFGIVCWAVRDQITALPAQNPGALCNGGVSWFGVQLRGDEERCARYR